MAQLQVSIITFLNGGVVCLFTIKRPTDSRPSQLPDIPHEEIGIATTLGGFVVNLFTARLRLAFFRKAHIQLAGKSSRAGTIDRERRFRERRIGGDEFFFELGRGDAHRLLRRFVRRGDDDRLFELFGQRQVACRRQAGASAMPVPLVIVQAHTGKEVGKLRLDVRRQFEVSTGFGPALIVLRPQAVQDKAQLFAEAALLRIIAAAGRTIIG